MKTTTLLFTLTLLLGVLGLDRASAQMGAPPPPMVPSPGMPPTANQASRITRIVRIYNGAGSFDDALADRLRPMLAKAFPSSMPESTKATPGATIAAPLKPENQRQIAGSEAPH